MEEFNKKRNISNKLNELSGKDWIKFTKSWFILRPKKRDGKILHPGSFPEELVEGFINFFTKKGQWVFDPFLGSGSTLVACRNTERNGVGIEITEKYASISQERLKQRGLTETEQIIMQEDSNNIEKLWAERNLPLMDFCITSPPYWNQLTRNKMRQQERKARGLDTKYSEDSKDIGNIENYNEFIDAQEKIFDKVYNVMKPSSYLVVITNNVFADGRLYPLAFDTLNSLSKKWVPKDEKIWLQDDKSLLPLGIYSAWVGNRAHQYCLIFKKEVQNKK
jgi:DNA modification methylase